MLLVVALIFSMNVEIIEIIGDTICSPHAPLDMSLVIPGAATIALIWSLPSIGFMPSPAVLQEELLSLVKKGSKDL